MEEIFGKLNSVIRADLHIHSSASSYKDGKIVAESTAANLDVLFEKLEINQINLFSITDHNRFNSEIYIEAREIIQSKKYPHVQNIIAGIEFDVRFEQEKVPAHVIALFDIQEWSEESSRIEATLLEQALTKPDESYSTESFESIIRKIGLRVMLIAHQHEGVTSIGKKKRSLNTATEHAAEMLYFGYIDAVEYNNSKTQGVLKDEFYKLNIPRTAIIGSDCHEWNYYPAHDSEQQAKEYFYTRVKCLPTFQGLLMAFTSPETRFQVPEPKQKDTYTKSFSFNKETIPLCAGINVIIGENGAGKSSLLSLFLDPNSRKTWIQKFKKANEVEIPCTLDESKSVIVSQGELRKRYDQDALISSARYSPVSHEAFEEKVTAFTNAIKQTMLLNIQRRQNDNQLQQSVLKIHPELEIETFDIGVSVSGDFSTVDNPHKERLTALNKIADGIQAELDSHYYDKESVEQLAQAKTAIESVIKKIQAKNDEIELEIEAKSLIYLAIEEYKSNCSIHKTDRDNEVSGYRENQRLFIKTILDKAKDVITPDIQIPKIILGEYDGVSSNTSNGFTFVKTAAYREDSNIEDSLLSLLFNQGLSSLEAIRKLDEQTKVTNAVRGASKGNWETKWEENISKYKEAAEKVTPSIHDQRQNQPLGNTLGEQSLTFYKYKTYNSADWETMFLDQPEDDISQSRIHGDLIEYFNRIRGNHQLVLVTHNPLLVVNQDVDNVIVINKERGSTKILSGCLESPGILEEVAEHMDGGRRAIEKRLKAYGPERMGKNE